ncbi:MAG: hypothetical protein ACRYG7_11520 [Janthinobacterium lividum]
MRAEVYFDKNNNWVFIDWTGDLTLETVQHTCLSIARCFLDHYYPRVLNSNAQVTSVTWEVGQWLASDFLPAMSLTGIEQMAWVVPPTLRARNKVLDTVNLFPHVVIGLFQDVEAAVAWLQQTAPPPISTGCGGAGRHFADEQKLHRLVNNFEQELAAVPATANPKAG